MAAYKAALDQYLSTLEQRLHWNRCVPDELCALISNLSDFREFLSFVSRAKSGEFDYEVTEFDCESTEDFINSLLETFEHDHFKARIAEKKIHTELGLLAFAMILALGSEPSQRNS